MHHSLNNTIVIKANMLELYGHPRSPPCRSVQLILDELELEYKYNFLDFIKGEHMSPEYLALNPQHSMPMLKDGDVTVLESRAIMSYVINKYASKEMKEKLYPQEPVELRAKIEERLYFDMGVLYGAYANSVYRGMMGGSAFNDQDRKKMYEALEWTDGYLKETGYFAGTRGPTIADFSLMGSFSNYLVTAEILELDLSKFPELLRWEQKMKKEVKKYDGCGTGAEQFAQLAGKLIKK